MGDWKCWLKELMLWLQPLHVGTAVKTLSEVVTLYYMILLYTVNIIFMISSRPIELHYCTHTKHTFLPWWDTHS